ncbi:MAG: glycosyltransferase family 4 protein [Candidatus Heimdallarchaeota archaeon]
MMNIGIFVSGYLPYHVYGIPRHVERLSAFLSSRGHKVWIFARGERGLKTRSMQSDSVRVIRSRSPTLLKASYSFFQVIVEIFFYTIYSLLIFPWIIRSEKIDLILGNGSWYGGWQATVCAFISRRPLVCTIHGYGIDYYNKRKSLPWMLRFLRKCEKIIVQRLSAVTTLQGWEFSRSSITYLDEGAVDTNKFAMGDSPADETKILFVGRLTNFKGPHLLIDALPEVIEYIDSSVVFVGDGEEKNKLIRRIAELDLQDKVEFVGQIEDVAPWYTRATIFVSLSPFNNYSDLALMEAMSSGLAVIATNSGETSRLIIHNWNGILIDSDPHQLANAIVRVSKKRQKLNYLGRNARKTIENDFSLSNWGTQMEKILLEVHKTRKHS